jgi:hypothetical protein
MHRHILTDTTTKLILAYKIKQFRTNFKGLSTDLRRSNVFSNEMGIWDIGIITNLCFHVSHLSQSKTSTTNFFGSFKKKKKEKLKRKTIAKYKPKEKLTKVKNLLLLPRQRYQKMFFMAAALFFKMPLVGTPSAE